MGNGERSFKSIFKKLKMERIDAGIEFKVI